MTTSSKDKQPRTRRARGLRSVSESVAGLTKPLFAKRGLADGRIAKDWPEIVGPELSERTLPEKIAYSPHKSVDGALVLRTDSGALALELQHLTPFLIERVNSYFGYRAVASIKLVQGPLPHRPKPEAPKPPRPLEPEEEASLDQALDGITDPELREVLERLGRSILGED